MSPLVSIIMPFKNTGAYLGECLNSIEQQSYQNWELLAVDDHSEDHSRAILDKAALTDTRIKVIENTGEGIIPALKTGYGCSSGTYITRMDSDDIMARNRLQKMLEDLKISGRGYIALGLVRYFSDRGISAGYRSYEKWLNALTANGNNFTDIYKECVIPSPCWMVSREDFEQAGGFESERYPEDYDLTFRFYEAGLKCLPAAEVLLHWRDYDSRTSRNSEHYAQNYFLDIKMHYFMRIDRDHSRDLVVWGAGFKGKKIARTLIDNQQAFTWLCDNPNKIGKKIYAQPLLHYSALTELDKPQSIITVANRQAQLEIRAFLESHDLLWGKDYYLFC